MHRGARGSMLNTFSSEGNSVQLYLIRHGQTVMNAAHIIDSKAPGADLSDLGREQAAGIPARLEGIDFDAIYVSNLVRTHQTAAPLARDRGIEPIEDSRLREIEAGAWEDRGDDDAYAGYIGTLISWMRGNIDEPMGGGVTGRDILARYDAAIADIEATGAQRVAVVSHGGIIAVWSVLRSGFGADSMESGNYLRNTGFSILEGSLASGYRSLGWNA